MAEAEWRMKGHVPSWDECMAVTVPSFGLGPITFTSFCLLGPELSEEVVRSREYGEMIRCVATCSRFLNDLRTYEREEEQGKTNSVLLLAPRYGGSIQAGQEGGQERPSGVQEGATEDGGQGQWRGTPADAAGVLEHLQGFAPDVQRGGRLHVDQQRDIARGECGGARAAGLAARREDRLPGSRRV